MIICYGFSLIGYKSENNFGNREMNVMIPTVALKTDNVIK